MDKLPIINCIISFRICQPHFGNNRAYFDFFVKNLVPAGQIAFFLLYFRPLWYIIDYYILISITQKGHYGK